nr:FAD-dependent oxidoreductase [Candidatus Dadabacteria bacterium]
MNQHSTNIHSDFLVIGSGLAGLYSAYYASKFGSVSLVTKSTIEQSNSYWAQGGIAAAIDPDDSHMFHNEDTLKAGRGLCNTEAVDILVREGIQRVLNLMKLGMKFDVGNEGFHLGMEGGHSKRRVLQASGTSTGKEIVSFLINEIKKSEKIKVFENTQVLKILTHAGRCRGGIAVNYYDDNIYIFSSNATILATGGASALYQRSTNPPGATGEGIALAYNEGAQVMDMEFIQFHPTSYYSESGKSFLLSEALRGEGAILLNECGQRFMESVHERAELAPRD